jgi:hypothetical protein
MRSRIAHVRKAFDQGIRALNEDGRVSSNIVQRLDETSEERSFILGWLHEPTSKMDYRAQVKSEVLRMFDWFESVAEPRDTPNARPVYKKEQLLAALREGNRNFLKYWKGILGLSPDEGPEKEHWARIKALNRRIVENRNNYEYEELRPIADLITFVMDELSLELEDPVEVQSYGATEEDTELAVQHIRQELDDRLHATFTFGLVGNHVDDWKTAYGYSGRGSTKERARKIVNDIYHPEAPEYREVDDSKLAAVFDEELEQDLVEAVEEGGGEVRE